MDRAYTFSLSGDGIDESYSGQVEAVISRDDWPSLTVSAGCYPDAVTAIESATGLIKELRDPGPYTIAIGKHNGGRRPAIGTPTLPF